MLPKCGLYSPYCNIFVTLCCASTEMLLSSSEIVSFKPPNFLLSPRCSLGALLLLDLYFLVQHLPFCSDSSLQLRVDSSLSHNNKTCYYNLLSHILAQPKTMSSPSNSETMQMGFSHVQSCKGKHLQRQASGKAAGAGCTSASLHIPYSPGAEVMAR